MSFLLLSTWNFLDGQVEGTILKLSYSLIFLLKSCGVGGGGLHIFRVSTSPLGTYLGF